MASVLIIDDDDVKRHGIADQVELLGHEILMAENGLEGMVVARNKQPDVILLDIAMPVMNGVEFLDERKLDAAVSQIPVVVITGQNSGEASVAECIRNGADDFLKMPPDQAILSARISSAIDRRQHQRSQERMQHRLEGLFLQVRSAEERADSLLHSIFPKQKVRELKETDDIKPTRHDDVAVMFCDVVGFTTYCDVREPEDVLGRLQILTTDFEDIAQQYRLEKIKTIGDCFMATAGLLEPDPDAAWNGVRCAMDFLQVPPQRNLDWNLRIGIHVGPLISGKLGKGKYLFDVWGSTVNIAARVEAAAPSGTVAVSKDVWHRVADRCEGESLGRIHLKNVGERELFRIVRLKS